MRTILFLTLFLFTSLLARENASVGSSFFNVASPEFQKVLYLNYEQVPKRVVKGEIFSITLKVLSTIKDTNNINYEFSDYKGLKPLNLIPYREKRGKYLFETFYFLTIGNIAKLPNIEASITGYDSYKSTTLEGNNLNVITLNPDKNFSNIIANSFEITDYKTTTFDDKHNIIIFIAEATNSDISAIKFNNVFKQGIESITESYRDSKVTYFLIVDKGIENFSFSYFNLLQNKFLTLNIPIIVEEDSVTTQSDLKPTSQSHEILKIKIATVITVAGLIFIIWRKKYIYLILILIPATYIGYLAIPSQDVCINKGAKIHLLPVNNGTIFETTQEQIHLQKEGSVTDFVKVKLPNEKIGWVKNEDICSN